MSRRLRRTLLMPALGLVMVVSLYVTSTASAAGPYTMTISSDPTSGDVTDSGTVITPGANGDNLNIAQLQSDLTSGNVSVGGGQASTITVEGTISSSQTHTLTLAPDSGVLLGGDTTLTTDGAVDFASTVDSTPGSPYNLTVDGDATFDDAVGGATPLASLTLEGSGLATLNGGVTTTGAQVYAPAVQLASNATLTSTGNSSITFESTVDGDNSLSVSTGGPVSFDGAVGGATGLWTLQSDGDPTNLGGNVSTRSTQQYNGPVELTSDVTLNSSNVQNIGFGSTVDGAYSLTVGEVGVLTFSGNVGSGTPLQSLDSYEGPISLDGSIATSGNQDYQSHVELGSDVTISPGAGAKAEFWTTVSGGTLTMAGAGLLRLDGADSATNTVIDDGTLDPNSAGFGTGPVTLNGGTLQWGPGSGNADFSSKLVVGSGGGSLDTDGNDVTFANALTGTGMLTKTGVGTLTLAGSGTYGRQLDVNAGSVDVTGATSTPIVVNSSGTLACTNGTLSGGVTNHGGTTSGAPAAPTGVSATAANSTVTVGFTPGAANCYPVSYSAATTSGGLSWGPQGSSPFTITSLTGGTPYSFKVTASNPIGSAVSAASNSVTPQAAAATKSPGGPTISVTAPAANVTYKFDQAVTAQYGCQDGAGGPGIASCSGTVASGSQLLTDVRGTHQFTVTATSSDGQTATTTVTYTVLAPSNAFVIKSAAGRRTGQATLTLVLPGAGNLSVRYSGTGTKVRTVRRTASRAGTVKLTIAAPAPLKHHQLPSRLKVSVTYTPTGGISRTVSRSVRL